MFHGFQLSLPLLPRCALPLPIASIQVVWTWKPTPRANQMLRMIINISKGRRLFMDYARNPSVLTCPLQSLAALVALSSTALVERTLEWCTMEAPSSAEGPWPPVLVCPHLPSFPATGSISSCVAILSLFSVQCTFYFLRNLLSAGAGDFKFFCKAELIWVRLHSSGEHVSSSGRQMCLRCWS